MKIAYIIPEHQYSFFQQVVPRSKHELVINSVKGVDGVLYAILPCTPSWDPSKVGLPYVLWHWDLYSYTDYTQPRWMRFLGSMGQASRVWSCSYETARELKERIGIDSDMVPAWVDFDELEKYRGAKKQKYAYFAASGCGFGKRIDWAEEACKLLGVKLIVSRGQSMPREQYLKTLTECQVYIMPAFEESNGSIPAMEAAALGIPLVCADIPTNKEVFGDTAEYFPVMDFRGIQAAILRAMNSGVREGSVFRMRMFDVSNVVKLFDYHLEAALGRHVQSRAR